MVQYIYRYTKEGSMHINRTNNGQVQIHAYVKVESTGKWKKQQVAAIKESEIIDRADCTTQAAIVWNEEATLGNTSVFGAVLGKFPPGLTGENATLPCDILDCGKFRNGKARLWCRTHQQHYGTKADLEFAALHRQIACAGHQTPMHFVKCPQLVVLADYAEVSMWCALSPLNSGSPQVPLGVHVHARRKSGGVKAIDDTFQAVRLVLDGGQKMDITTQTAHAWYEAKVRRIPMQAAQCPHCNSSHLDLGVFAVKPHKKHLCANCGNDAFFTKTEAVCNPLETLFRNELQVKLETTIDVTKFDRFDVWQTTPAFLHKSLKPQPIGIHVHGYRNDRLVCDESFGSISKDLLPSQ